MRARHCGPLSWLAWHLLAFLFPRAATQATPATLPALPATVEVDLIYPRNETYAPAPHMPVVFAIQNSAFAAALDPIFYLQLWRVDLNYSVAFDFQIRTVTANFSSSDPYFVYFGTNTLNHTEGLWALQWQVLLRNCSRQGLGPLVQRQEHEDFVMFTTKNGAPQPDLVAAAAGNACDGRKGFAVNVTDLMIPFNEPKNEDGSQDGRNASCAILSPMPAPEPQPCRVKMDAAAASSITAAISASPCVRCHSGAAHLRSHRIAFVAAFPLMYLLI